MKLNFDEFQFDTQTQLLSRSDELVPLNEKSGKLLSLFLSSPDKIYSKDDILSEVWSDRVVSDQVVFQNISILRALFGQDSIKTFPKKGYQWQLQITIAEEIAPNNSQTTSESPITDNSPSESLNAVIKPSAKLNVSIALVILVCIFGLGGWFYMSLSAENVASNNVKYTFKLINSDKYQEALPNTFSLIEQNSEVFNTVTMTQSLFDSPFETWRKYQKSDSDLLLAFRTYEIFHQGKPQLVLRFLIQGKQRGWQGHIVKENLHQIDTYFSEFLNKLQSIDYFLVESERAILAQLSLLHNQTPNDPIVTLQLAKSYFEIEEFSILTALIEQSKKRNSHPLYIGLFNLVEVLMFGREEKREEARVVIQQAIKHFSELSLHHLISSAQINAAYAFIPVDKTLSHQYLSESINNARKADEPLLEMRGHVVQAFIASKQKEYTLMEVGFTQATKLFELNGFSQEHFVEILRHRAAAVKEVERKLEYYLKVLEQPYSNHYLTYYYEAVEFVQDYYIGNNDIEKLKTTIYPWQNQTFKFLSQAKIAHLQGNKELAINMALEAFNSAQVDYEKYYALDAALLLITFNQEGHLGLDDQKYVDYINNNVSVRWKRINREKLNGAGYW